jgi:protein-S-isoprenylcysteine O-methyltransferase Ste14
VEPVFVVLGLLVAVAGLLLVLLGLGALGRSLTPFPRPHARAELREGGVLKLVRHPIYGGLLLVALAWSLAEAPLACVPTLLLALVFDLKARREEEWLSERYTAYDAYRQRTPHRLLPWLY